VATDDYGQGVTVYTNPETPNLEAIAKNLAGGIIPRSIMRFASASARSAALTGVSAPVEGMHTTLADTNRTYRYDGSAWQPIAALVQSGTVSLSFSSLDQYSGTGVTFPVAFPAAPRVSINIHSGVGATGRWNGRAINVTATGFTPFVYSGADGATSTWSAVEIMWIATSP
jgi:hypothetical protein